MEVLEDLIEEDLELGVDAIDKIHHQKKIFFRFILIVYLFF